MIIETPHSQCYSAALLMGKLECRLDAAKKLDCTGSPLSMAVVMKSAYDLSKDSENIWQMKAVADPERSAIVMEDRGLEYFTKRSSNKLIRRLISQDNYVPDPNKPKELSLRVDGEKYLLSTINNTQQMSISFEVAYEADTALAKEKADIIVLGFVAKDELNAVELLEEINSNKSEVFVDDDVWLTRDPISSSAIIDNDMERNLFGFEPRTSAVRWLNFNQQKYQTAASMHRRGLSVFKGGNIETQLPSAAVIKIYQGPQINDTESKKKADFILQLPALEQGIRLRVYCGHGPDEAPYWRKVNLGLMRPDTLIVEPSKQQAVILWRCHWNADLEPMEHYRKVQIRQGGF